MLALKLAAGTGEPWTQADLARSLHLSASEVNHGLKRLAACHLYNARERRVARASLLEFLVFGLRFVFPARLGLVGRGMPTSIGAAPALASKLALDDDDDDRVVWPVEGPLGRVRGRVIAPLYGTAPAAAAEDPGLHEYLALADALRVGRARERALAKAELTRRLAS